MLQTYLPVSLATIIAAVLSLSTSTAAHAKTQADSSKPPKSSRSPGSPEALKLFKRGYMLADDHRDYQGAIEFFTRAIKLDPTYAPAYIERARALMERHEFARALADCNKAITINPGSRQSYSARSFCNMHLGRYKEGIADCDKVIAMSPANESSMLIRGAYWNRSQAYQRLGKPDLARRDARKAAMSGATVGTMQDHYQGIRCLNNADYTSAIQHFDKALAAAPERFKIYFMRASAKAGLENFEEAIKDYTAYLDREPKSYAAHFGRAEAYQETGHDNLAIGDYTEAIALAATIDPAEVMRPRSTLRPEGKYMLKRQDAIARQLKTRNDRTAAAYNARGQSYSRSGSLINALADYSAAIDLKPDPDIIANRAAVYYQLKNYALAMKDYDTVLASNVRDKGAILMRRGELNEAMHRYDKAIADYSSILQLNKNDDDAIWRRARVRVAAGRLEEALEDYDRFIALNPHNTRALEERKNLKEELKTRERPGEHPH